VPCCLLRVVALITRATHPAAQKIIAVVMGFALQGHGAVDKIPGRSGGSGRDSDRTAKIGDHAALSGGPGLSTRIHNGGSRAALSEPEA
jgi:hypothetical protein